MPVPKKEKLMFRCASPDTHAIARLLRKNETEAEKRLWSYLRLKPQGFKFRRQHPLSIYIADFYCHKANLVIELDGEIHLKREVRLSDKQRSFDIKNMGMRILRFKNEEVMGNIDSVINTINVFLLKYCPLPSGRDGEGRNT
jgi:very-short-patch-repair endonuclease